MKYPIQLGTLAAAIVVFAISMTLLSTADARIGEGRDALESRLFRSGGIVYRDDDIEESRRKGMPYLRFLDYFSSAPEVRIYFKTSDGRRPMSSELEAKRIPIGWDLHVLYVNGKSVVEIYKRSQGMSEFEFNQLLALHAEGSFWKRLTKEEKADVVSAFGFEMARNDGRVRAKKLGNDSVLFVDSEVDVKLSEMNTTSLQERAPISVEGF